MESAPANQPQKIEQQEKVFYENSFEDPAVIVMPKGVIAAATDIGPVKNGISHNEDRIVILPSQNAFSIIDGMGGYGNGNQMAQIVAEEVAITLAKNPSTRDFGKMHAEANSRMRKEEQVRYQGGAVYTACKLIKKSFQYG